MMLPNDAPTTFKDLLGLLLLAHSKIPAGQVLAETVVLMLPLATEGEVLQSLTAESVGAAALTEIFQRGFREVFPLISGVFVVYGASGVCRVLPLARATAEERAEIRAGIAVTHWTIATSNVLAALQERLEAPATTPAMYSVGLRTVTPEGIRETPRYVGYSAVEQSADRVVATKVLNGHPLVANRRSDGLWYFDAPAESAGYEETVVRPMEPT